MHTQFFPELKCSLENLQPGEHLCCLYQTEAEHRAVLTPFLQIGLARGEKVIYITDLRAEEQICAYLQQDGCNARERIRKGQFVFLEKEQAYLRGGVFDPEAMIAFLRAAEAQAAAEGYAALRVSGEMSWALRGMPGSERLIEYEARLNEFLPASRCIALCQYDMRRFDPRTLLDVLRTHPIAVIGADVYDNFYYIPPEEFLYPADQQAAILRNWLSSLAAYRRETAQLMSAMLDHTPSLIVYMDTDFNILRVNRAFAQTAGRPAEEYCGKNFFDLFPQETLRADFRRAAESGQPARGVLHRPPVWWEWTLAPLKKADGGAAGLIFSGEDVSAHKQLEAQLEASEKHFRALVESSPNCILVVQDGKYVYANPASVRLIGYRLEEFIGMDALSIIHPEDRPALTARMRAIAEGKSNPPMKMRAVKKDGEVYIAESTSLPILFNERPSALVISRDITAQAQAEKALQAERERLQAALQALQAGAWEWDLASGLLTEDARCRELHGFAQGSPFSVTDQEWRQHIHPDDIERVESVIAAALEKTENFQAEYRVKDGQGGWRWIAAHAVVLRDENGSPQRVIGNCFDVSERKQAEEEKNRLLANARHQAETLSAIVHLSSALRAAQTLHEAVPMLVELSVKSLNAERGALLMLERDQLRLKHSYGYESPPADDPRESALDALLQAGQICLLSALEPGHPLTEDPLLRAFILPGGGCALIPLRVRERPVGILIAASRRAQPFTPEQTSLAAAISDIAGNALQRMRLMERLEDLVNDRTRHLQTLYEVISAVSASLDLRQSLNEALLRLIEIMGCAHGGCYLLSEDGRRLELIAQYNFPLELVAQLALLPVENSLEGSIVERGEPLLIADMILDPRTVPSRQMYDHPHAYLGAPMRAGGKISGVLCVIRAGQSFNLDEISLISSIAEHLALYIENDRLRHQAEQALVLEERARLARNLHDSATQSLYAASLFSNAAALAENGSPEERKTCLHKLNGAIQQSLKEMRLLMHQLYPPSFASGRLEESLRSRLASVEQRAGVEFTLSCPVQLELPQAVEEALYWIASEALNNALRHAAATSVEVVIKREKNRVSLQVSDNGRGFDPARAPCGMGLNNMRQRAAQLNGTLTIASAAGQGSSVTAAIPLG